MKDDMAEALQSLIIITYLYHYPISATEENIMPGEDNNTN